MGIILVLGRNSLFHTHPHRVPGIRVCAHHKRRMVWRCHRHRAALWRENPDDPLLQVGVRTQHHRADAAVDVAHGLQRDGVHQQRAAQQRHLARRVSHQWLLRAASVGARSCAHVRDAAETWHIPRGRNSQHQHDWRAGAARRLDARARGPEQGTRGGSQAADVRRGMQKHHTGVAVHGRGRDSVVRVRARECAQAGSRRADEQRLKQSSMPRPQQHRSLGAMPMLHCVQGAHHRAGPRAGGSAQRCECHGAEQAAARAA